MWQRFSDEARKAVALADEEATKAGKMVTSTEHILLRLVHDEASIASQALSKLGVTPKAIEGEIAKLEPDPVSAKPRSKMILSRDAKQAVDHAYKEAQLLTERLVQPEHLLLGLISQGGAAAKVLSALGVDLQKAREAIVSVPKPECATQSEDVQPS